MTEESERKPSRWLKTEVRLAAGFQVNEPTMGCDAMRSMADDNLANTGNDNDIKSHSQ